MSKLRRALASQVLIILVFAGLLTYINPILDLHLGLDLAGGSQLKYTVDLTEVAPEDKSQVIEGNMAVMERRTNSLGVAEANIYTEESANETHIVVELPGIENLDEAKELIGKTVQLEFKELNTADPEVLMQEVRELADAFYAEASPENLEELTEDYNRNHKEEVSYRLYDNTDLSTLPQEVQDAVANANIGDFVGPIEVNDGFTLNDANEVEETTSMAIFEVQDKETETKENFIEESRNFRHILISHSESSNALNERSKEEALNLANETLVRIQALPEETGEDQGPIIESVNGEDLTTEPAPESFESIAEEISDDANAGPGGDLGRFTPDTEKTNALPEAVREAAFSLQAGQTSEVIETELGFHILQVYASENARTETETIERASLAYTRIAASQWAEEAYVTGEHFKHADVATNPLTYEPIVSITFTDEGGDRFEELTARNVGQPVAIFVGGEYITAPTIQETISGGQGQISDVGSIERAQELARELNTGAIPAEVDLVGQYTISPTLGAEALDMSLQAAVIGLIALAIYMLLYYRLPGLIANAALFIYSMILLFFIQVELPVFAALGLGLAGFSYLIYLILNSRDSGSEQLISFLLACIVLFFLIFVFISPITLTLAGIAGVILSIGMAVDANVLIFERLKEELHNGRKLKDAISEGFDRAWPSIRDSNFSSLITCGILFAFGSSIIRGFALNLALGILVSMFSAIVLTRTFLLYLAETGAGKHNWLFAHAAKEKGRELQIIKRSKVWAGFSGILLLIAIISVGTFGLRLGLDFTGGTLMELQFEDEVAVENLRTEFSSIAEDLSLDLGTPQVVSTDQNTFIIRSKNLSEEEHSQVMAGLEELHPNFEELRFTTVGPTLGSSLKRKAVYALIGTLIMIVLYMGFAFRNVPKEVSPWRFGFSAIAALVHDVLIVVGVFVLLGHFFGTEIDALFVTALLTILGFSVHDSIVVLDRIRENLKYRERNESLGETANKALNQTMARSLNTSISTLITIVALLIFGAPSIQMFVLALAVGIVAGTYSSIFVASPLLVWWNEKWPR